MHSCSQMTVTAAQELKLKSRCVDSNVQIRAADCFLLVPPRQVCAMEDLKSLVNQKTELRCEAPDDKMACIAHDEISTLRNSVNPSACSDQSLDRIEIIC